MLISTLTRQMTIFSGRMNAAFAALVLLAVAACASGAEPDPVLEAEAKLIGIIDRVAPAAVCINDSAQRGGGSGVLIDAQGYGLTNYHVVAGMIDKRRGWGGLSDGKLYELEVLGIDPIGDIAMFRLMGDREFPFAPLGDSDRVQIGDTVIAAGNPFILSEDYTPSISVGLVSGTHRYQWGVGGNLIYSDCIQVDAAINPGNSGGALFNLDGEIIGINGRISVGARGRLNVGHGYAISANQVRRFIPALRAGLVAHHGTLGASVIEPDRGNVLFADVTAGGAADRAGIKNADRLLRFDGVPVRSQNVFASMLGTYPADWPVVMEMQSGELNREVVVRLDPVPPRLRVPFSVERSVNLAAVRRVLGRFRRAVFRDASTQLSGMLSWTAERKHLVAEGEKPHEERFEVLAELGGRTRMVRRFDDRTSGFQIEFDEATATKRLTPDGDAMDLSAGDRIVLNALYVMQQRLLVELTDDELADVSHIGADAIIVAAGETRRSAPDPLEVIEWSIGGQTQARFSFDQETGRLVRIRTRDVATNEEATIEVSGYNWAAGLTLPHVFDVRRGESGYVETRLNWNIK